MTPPRHFYYKLKRKQTSKPPYTFFFFWLKSRRQAIKSIEPKRCWLESISPVQHHSECVCSISACYSSTSSRSRNNECQLLVHGTESLSLISYAPGLWSKLNYSHNCSLINIKSPSFSTTPSNISQTRRKSVEGTTRFFFLLIHDACL